MRWPPSVEIVNAGGRSPVILLCPHASNFISPEYGSLGLAESELQRHIAWDIGAAGLTRALAERLDAPAFLGTSSRLLIDLNRPLHSASSIVTRSEATEIPGNAALSEEERALRAQRVFLPYHAAVSAHLAERKRESRPVVLVAVHSFTPTFHGVPRPWHVGLLFVKSEALARSIMTHLSAAHPDLCVGANVPYDVTPDSDYGLLVYGDDVGNPAVEFEIRQDLLTTPEDQQVWAERLARSLAAAAGDR